MERTIKPYDFPGVEYGHRGELCSFDAFLDKHDLNDPALRQLAVIVRGADTAVSTSPRSAPACLRSRSAYRKTSPTTM